MENRYPIIILLLMLLMAACCQVPVPDGGTDTPETVELCVGFALPGGETVKGLAPSASEVQISKMHLFVFDSHGVLDLIHTLTAAEKADRSVRVRLRTGTSSLWLVANVDFPASFLEGLISEATLEAFTYSGLAEGLPMVCHQSLEIPAGGLDGTLSLQLSFAVSRIALNSVRNALQWPLQHKEILLRGAVVCNAVANRTLAGAAPEREWLNREGTRSHQAGQVIGATLPAYLPDAEETEALLLAGDAAASGLSASYQQTIPPGETCALESFGAFYAFPNVNTEPNSGWHDEFLETATVLLVIADIDGRRYWYPVPLTFGLAENRNYKIDLVISGFGNDVDHWFERLERISLACAVGTGAWTTLPDMIPEFI